MVLPSAEVLATDLAQASLPHLGKLLARIGREQFDKFVATSTNVFNDHLKDTIARCSTTKNILYRDPVPLLTQYVSNDFTAVSSPIADERVLKHAQSSRITCLVTGLAGSGKSMFMKWLALTLADSILYHQRIPLFIEARNLSDETLESPLDVIIFQSTSSERSPATFAQFRVGLEHGIFIVLIDGLDEISPDLRDNFLREVSDFRRRFRESSIVCSSRPERQIESLADLQVLRINDMSLNQIKEVIDNTIFDDEKKKAFVRELEGGLYEDHKSFLSNPLLAIIMLITYDNNANIPRKLSSFYSQVFEALFFRHDSSKGVYTRKHFASLEIDQFEEAFRSFCFETYALGKLRFSSTDLNRLVRASLKRCGLETVRPEMFIKDMKQSVCLLQDDALEISFVHRSFQEYFAARYLLYYKGDVFPQVLDRLAVRASTDNVLKMLYEMNAMEVKRLWIVPKLRSFAEQLNNVDTGNPESLVDFIVKWFDSVLVDRNIEIKSVYSDKSNTVQLSTIVGLLGDDLGVSGDIFLNGRVFGSGEPFRSFLLSDSVQEAGLSEYISRLFSFFENKETSLNFNKSAEKWIMLSNIPEMVVSMRAEIIRLAEASENQTAETESFASDILRIMTG